jgi:geranylgeranylglycerol-phosphate geranylgeranyltransferase
LQYGGIKKGYPNLRRYFGRLAVYLQLVRPFTLVSPLLAGLLGILASTPLFNMNIVKTCIYVGITLSLAQACGQVINQYADVELDKIVKPYRPLASGVIGKDEALGLAWLLAIVGIARAFTVTTVFGLITVLLVFFAVFYSLSPFSPRRIHPSLNILWMAVSRGLIPVFAVWSIYGSWHNALPYALLAFVWVLGFQGTKDVEDIEGDRKFGIKTVFSEYGFRGLRFLMILCTIIYVLIAEFFSKYLMLLLVPIAIFGVLKVGQKSRLTENTLGWVSYYLGLGLLFILMLLSCRLL